MTDQEDGRAEAITMGHVSLVVLSWADLVLDSDNPRVEVGGETTRESINTLIELDADKQVNIARDISESNMLSPFDLPGVVWEDESWVVVEGNRRVAALKMLKAPDLIADPRIRRRVEAIAANGTGPDDVACSQFEDRSSARRWIELRHTGENDGRGVSSWDSDMRNRFSRDPGSQTDLAMQLRDHMTDSYPNDQDLLHQLDVIFRGGNRADGTRIRKRPTTLGRLLEPKEMQDAFGYSIDAGNIVIVGPEPAVHDAFRQIIFDVSEGMTARDINTREQIRSYIRNCGNLIIPPPTPNPSPSTPSSNSGSGSTPPVPTLGQPGGAAAAGAAGSGNQPTPTPPPPPLRRRMPREERKIFDGLKLHKFDIRTTKTLAQAQRIDIDQAPAVAGVMVRVIVELCATEAVAKLNLNATEGDHLHKKLRACILHLDPGMETRHPDKTLQPAWINSQKSTGDGLGVVLMNSFVHGLNKTAAPSEVRVMSSEFRPVLERLNDALAQLP